MNKARPTQARARRSYCYACLDPVSYAVFTDSSRPPAWDVSLDTPFSGRENEPRRESLMDSSERTVMQKETLIKEDGRRLIYYRFVSEPTAPETGDKEG